MLCAMEKCLPWQELLLSVNWFAMLSLRIFSTHANGFARDLNDLAEAGLIDVIYLRKASGWKV